MPFNQHKQLLFTIIFDRIYDSMEDYSIIKKYGIQLKFFSSKHKQIFITLKK